MILFIAILIALVLLVAVTPFLLLLIQPKHQLVNETVLASLPEFRPDYTDLPERTSYVARDGSKLDYRYYSADTSLVLILLHGISMDGQYLHILARHLSASSLFQVYTPDLRGYGANPARRGDCDYIGQLEDDLADLIRVIKREQPHASIVMGGHSGGGGTAIRFAGSRYASLVEGYLLLAPAISHKAPINYAQEQSTRMISVGLPRIIGLTILNQLGIHKFNALPVLVKNKSNEGSHGYENTAFSYRLALSRMPRDNYVEDLRALTKPTLLLAGTLDEEFKSEAYGPLFALYNKADIRILPDLTHDSLLLSPLVYREIAQWRGLIFPETEEGEEMGEETCYCFTSTEII